MPVLKHEERWQYDFRLNGKRHRGSLPEARTKRQAEQLAAFVIHSNLILLTEFHS